LNQRQNINGNHSNCLSELLIALEGFKTYLSFLIGCFFSEHITLENMIKIRDMTMAARAGARGIIKRIIEKDYITYDEYAPEINGITNLTNMMKSLFDTFNIVLI
jgi:hypothetical protein